MAEITLATTATVAGTLTFTDPITFANTVTTTSPITSNGGTLTPQIQPASVTIPTGYSYLVQTRYAITGTNNLTVQGNGIFAVR